MLTLRNALIRSVVTQKGPLAWQRRFQKARLALPELSPEDLAARLAETEPGTEGSPTDEEILADLERRKVKHTTLADGDYPLMLKQIADPPPVLFYSGEVQTLHRPGIAVVGSRSCSTYGRQITKKLAGDLAELGFTIVSGLALGIDAHAHRAALEVGGRTAAVLASGMDVIYPHAHRPLAREIIRRHGAILSEFPPGTPPKAFHFPIRNRIISGLAHATVIVEAREKSGSLITARHCLDQGRELLAVPGPIHRPTALGTNRLIFDGEAQMLLSIEDVLTQLKPLLGMAAAHQRQKTVYISDPLAQKIYDRLDAYESLALDSLLSELKLEPGAALARLVDLESLGLVEALPGQHYLRNPLRSGSHLPKP